MEHGCSQQTKSPYKPGVRRWTLYKSLWLKYWPEFESIYEEKYAARYGPITPDKHSEITKLLECGVFSNGFVVTTDLKLPEITDIILPLNLNTKGFTSADDLSDKRKQRQREPNEQGAEYVIGKNLARTRHETERNFKAAGRKRTHSQELSLRAAGKKGAETEAQQTGSVQGHGQGDT